MMRVCQRFSGVTILLGVLSAGAAQAQSKVWAADEGNGRYRNPVLFADYSDPDAIRVGEDYYLLASSFDQVPGLPILHSTDLVNWTLLTHALSVQPPAEVYSKTAHGNGVWAPSLRLHRGTFYIYYPDPEYGIYVTTARKITGPWTTPKLIKAARGWIDPCPFWDEDGHAYLINGMAASRSGIKNVLVLSRMSEDGTRLLDEGTLVIDGHGSDLTLEGPKLYRRGGYYYVFAPAGGVSTGYQLVYRSHSIYGPYERKVVLAQGQTSINGPHQGAWVDTPTGENWFLHFQDRGPYGRVTLLEPMRWENGWPVIGSEPNTQGISEPVVEFRKPKSVGTVVLQTPADSDEFNGKEIGLQWQWQANPQPGWAFPSASLGVLRLTSVPVSPSTGERLWDTPNVLSAKLPAPSFVATVKMKIDGLREGDRTGLVMLGRDYAYAALRRTKAGTRLVSGLAMNADRGGDEKEAEVAVFTAADVYLRATMTPDAEVQFSYSADGKTFAAVGLPFKARPGVWIGAKLGLFSQGMNTPGEFGHVDLDWFRVEPVAAR